MRLALTVQVLGTRGPLEPSGVEDIESQQLLGSRAARALPALGLTLRAKATGKGRSRVGKGAAPHWLLGEGSQSSGKPFLPRAVTSGPYTQRHYNTNTEQFKESETSMCSFLPGRKLSPPSLS